MVGVPALVDDVRFRAVGADRLALALQQPQPVDDARAEQEHEQQRGDDRAAGAERDVAEHIEDGELVRQIDQPIEHRINLVRTRLRRRPRRRGADRPLQRLDDGRHARAERALDHDDIAGTDRGQHLRLERGRVLCIAAAAAGGKSLPQRLHQRPAAEHEIDRIGGDRRRRAPRCSARPLGPSSSMSPSTAMRRPRGPTGAWPSTASAAAHRSRIGIVALVDEQRRPPGSSISIGAPRPDAGLNSASASAASARSAPTSSAAASTASELMTRWRPGAPIL